MVKPLGGNEHRVEYDEPHRLPPEVDLEPLTGETYEPPACAVRVHRDDDDRPIVAVEWLDVPATGHLVAAILAAGRLARPVSGLGRGPASTGEPVGPSVPLSEFTHVTAELERREARHRLKVQDLEQARQHLLRELGEARQTLAEMQPEPRPCYCGKIGGRHFPGAPGCAIPAPETMESALRAASKLVERLRAMHAPHSDPDQRSRCRTCIVGYDARVGDLVHDSFPCATRRLVDELAGPVLG